MARTARKTTQDGSQSVGIDHQPCRGIIEGLEADAKALKQQLALRGGGSAMTGTVKQGGDPFAHLAPQDAAWMRRRSGIKA